MMDKISKILLSTATMSVIIIILILFLVFLLYYSLVWDAVKIQDMDFILSVIAALIGYLVTTGTQIKRDRVERAKEFVEARRTDGEFRRAADKTWMLMRETNIQNTAKTDVPLIAPIDESIKDVATVADVYEEMAILIKYKHADEDLLYDYFGNPVIRFFCYYNDEIMSFRKISFEHQGLVITTATEYIEFEWLYKRWLPRYNSWVSESKIAAAAATI